MEESEALQAVQEGFFGDEDMSLEEDIQDLFGLVDKDITAWRPSPGDRVGGILRDITDSNEGDFGSYVILLIERPDGSLTGVHCFHKVLRGDIERRLERGTLQVGDQIAIKYIGESGKVTTGKNAANMYRVAVRRPE